MAPVPRWVLSAVLLTAAGASGWFLYTLDFDGDSTERVAPDAPEAYMENFATVEMDGAGRPRRRIEASYMAYHADRTVELTDPRYVLFSDEGEPWHVQSERARVSPDGSVLWLMGKVDIWRNDAAGTRDLDIRTEHLVVQTESEYAETTEAVTIRTPMSVSSGVGMRAWLDETRFELLSQVRTHVEEHSPQR